MRYPHCPDSALPYPPADRYVEAFGEAQLRRWLARRNIGGIVVPLAVRAADSSRQYTPDLLPQGDSAARKFPADEYSAKERRLVLEALLERDRAALRSVPTEEWEGDVIGIGPGALGRVGPACYQNYARLEDYRAALDANRLPVWRGLELTADDLARRHVMESLARHGRVSMEAIGIAHVLDFRSYFAREIGEIERLARDGLAAIEGDWIVLTDQGARQAARVCEAFDRYKRVERERASLGRVL